MIENIGTFILIIFLIILVGFFSASETAYLSLSKLKIRAMLEEKKANAKLVSKLKSNMDRLLSTLLVGINLLTSLTSALVTALAIKFLANTPLSDFVPFLTAFFISVFGQIVPKTAAGIYPQFFASFSSLPLFVLEKIFFPIIWLFEKLSGFVVKIVEKILKPSSSEITEEEIKALIDVGEKEGTIEKSESKMMNKIIKFNNLQVSDIMKHRSLVCMVNENATQKEVIEKFNQSGFSTITVYKNSKDEVVGILNYKKILYGSDENKGENFALRNMEKVLFVPATFSVLELLKKFHNEENKFAVVLNEQGQTAGIVTMKDVMKVVFDRMIDENSYDNIPPEDKIKLVSYNTFLVPGELKLEDVKSNLNLNLYSDDFNTLGGWLLEQFGYLPSTGNSLVYGKVVFTAEDVSARRIVTVRINLGQTSN